MLKFFVALLCLVLSGFAQAAKPDFSKEAWVTEDYSTTVAFQNDGSYTLDMTARIRVQSDAGVQRFGLLKFPYATSLEATEIVHLRVRKPDGTVVSTPTDAIQDMPAEVTQVAPFYSDLHEKHLAVKGLSPGDVLEYQYRSRVQKPAIPGQFWFQYNFAHDAIVLHEQLEISIPRERAVKLTSNDYKPVIADNGNRRSYTWTASNLEVKPDSEKDKIQKQIQQLHGKLPRADLQLSSISTWDDVGHWYFDLQQQKVQPTPEIAAKAAELTRGLSGDDAKTRAIYTYVSTRFRYIGIDFGVGRYQPHAAAEVMANQYGDCKDKHTLMASLLQAAGIQAYPALINVSHDVNQDVPTASQFDHVITAIPRGSDFLFLDTTSEVAPYGYLFSPLRNKPALVMAANSVTFVSTPADPPFPLVQTFDINASLDDAGTLSGSVERTDRSDIEALLRMAFRRLPQSQWQDLVQKLSFGDGFAGKVTDVTVSSPEETAAPLHYSYHYNREKYPDWANHRITMPAPIIALPDPESEALKQRPIFLGTPTEFVANSRVKLPLGYAPALPLNVHVTRDFAEYHALYDMKGGSLNVHRRLIVKKDTVPDEMRDLYQSFYKEVTDDRDTYIDVDTDPTTVELGRYHEMLNALGEMPDSKNPRAMKLEFEGQQALERKDDAGAIATFKRAVEADPSFSRAWIRLAVVYSYSKQDAQYDEALRKSIAANPKLLDPYEMLGYSAMRQNHADEAIAVWQQLLQVDPGNETALPNLGNLYFIQHKYAEAYPLFEAAAKKYADSFEIGLRLGISAARSGHPEQSTAAFNHLMEIAPGANTNNDVAYELAQEGIQLPQALQFAEKAVRSTEEASAKVHLDDLKIDDLRPTPDLAAYWDTLGWIHFKLGHLDQAERFLRASLNLSPPAHRRRPPRTGGRKTAQPHRRHPFLRAFARVPGGLRRPAALTHSSC